MRVIFAALIIGLCSAVGVAEADRADKRQCLAIKEKIRHVRSKMRAGYTRAQGERLEAKLRKLRKSRRKKCR